MTWTRGQWGRGRGCSSLGGETDTEGKVSPGLSCSPSLNKSPVGVGVGERRGAGWGGAGGGRGWQQPCWGDCLTSG